MIYKRMDQIRVLPKFKRGIQILQVNFKCVCFNYIGKKTDDLVFITLVFEIARLLVCFWNCYIYIYI